MKNSFASSQKWCTACRNSISNWHDVGFRSEVILVLSLEPCAPFWVLVKSKPRWSMIGGLTGKIEQVVTKSLSQLLCEEGLGLQVGDEVVVLVKRCSSIGNCFCPSLNLMVCSEGLQSLKYCFSCCRAFQKQVWSLCGE